MPLKDPVLRKQWRQEYYQKNKTQIVAKTKRYYYATKDARRAKAREMRDPGAERSDKLTARYGVDQVSYLKMLIKQGGVCKICKRDPGFGKDGRRLLQIDHCHDKGKIRGILCPSCNRGIAMFKHDPMLLLEAAKFVIADHDHD